ncbi:hypothetical protein [Kitasatospora sp. SUK 42]|uniref:hypothetical protein n=1 Tax=Kitasatospora sp. SUK 42 TaxID=1588882 RepID=UPI0018C935A4|nr:hypothetical protein [Kitasatospora sp. SUK 42]MBV2155845.1 hypothetical protein [Kitasatospora sp. SUK 42]
MNSTFPARAAVTAATVLLLAAAPVGSAASAEGASGRRDVTAEQCRAAGGHVEGSGYCVDAEGEDAWGEPIDAQAINPDPRPGEED